jgi:hypothetical protein
VSSTSTTRPSAIPKLANSTSNPSKLRLKRSLQPAARQVLDIQRSPTQKPSSSSSTIKQKSKSYPEGDSISFREEEPTPTDGQYDRISILEGDPPENEATISHVDDKASLLPESDEFEAMWNQIPRLDVRHFEHQKVDVLMIGTSGLNSMLLSVNRKRGILSEKAKQICQDGMAFYQCEPSSLIPESIVDAEIFKSKWNELQSATTAFVNELLEFQNDRKALAIKQDMLDYPERYNYGKAIADLHSKSEMGTDAKTSITVPLANEVSLTADGVKTRRELENEINNLQIRIQELYGENFSLTSGLDLEDIDLSDDQKAQVNENNGFIGQHEKDTRSLKLALHQLVDKAEVPSATA